MPSERKKDNNVITALASREHLDNDKKEMILKLNEMYRNNDIKQLRTAYNIASTLASKHKSTIKFNKGEKLFKKLIEKTYPEKNDYIIDVILYSQPATTQKEKGKKYYKGLKQEFKGQFNFSTSDISLWYRPAESFLRQFNDKFMTISPKALGRKPTEQEKAYFSK